MEGQKCCGRNLSDLTGGGVDDGEDGVVAEAEEAVAGVEDLGVRESVEDMGLVDEVVMGSEETDREEER